MFTGIVEEAGRVVNVELHPKGARFTVACACVHKDANIGDSISNNGCCLTVIAKNGNELTFDLLEETRRKTNLLHLKPGSLVNLERALAVGGRLGGHFVSGHVDDLGIISRWEREGDDYVLEIEVPPAFKKYIIPKGCVTIDGISLTVGPITPLGFSVWIIPHTYEVTALRERAKGDRVNLEFDLLAKYVEQLCIAKN